MIYKYIQYYNLKPQSNWPHGLVTNNVRKYPHTPTIIEDFGFWEYSVVGSNCATLMQYDFKRLKNKAKQYGVVAEYIVNSFRG